MLTSDACEAVKKQALENTSMHVYHSKSGMQTTSIYFEIKIDGFPKLKDDAIYSKSLSYKNWILNVLKKDKAVILTLDNFLGCRYVITCYIRYGKQTVSGALRAEKVHEATYIINISSEVINEAQNAYLRRGFLILELNVPTISTDGIVRVVTETRVLIKDEPILYTNEDKEETDERALTNDFTAMLYDSNFSNFRIKTSDYSAPVSKSIIAARSKFFFDYLKENPDSEEMEIDASREALKMVLKYMYSGTICVKPISKMHEVIKLAKKLQMNQLCELCNNFIHHSIDKL